MPIDPHPLFDSEWYLQQNPDVAATGINPLQHYMTHGWREGRDPNPLFDTSFYLEQNPDVKAAGVNPLHHYLTDGWIEGRAPHLEFDASWYLEQNTDVAAAGVEPLSHYLAHGKREGRRPLPYSRKLLLPPKAPDIALWDSIVGRANIAKATVDVIIPVYRGYDDTLACVYSVLNNKQETDYELIVVNDFGPDSRLNESLSALAARNKFSYVVNATNLGFVQTANLGLGLHRNRDVVILNSDTVVYSNWLDRILEHAKADSSVATITPFSNNATICSYPRTDAINRWELETSLEELDSFAAVCNRESSNEIPTGVGFCFFMRRTAMEQIGYFDSETFGLGYGEENDFCMRAKAAGYKNILAHDVFVQHTGGVSFSASSQAKSENAQKLLDQKHPEYHRLVRSYIDADVSRPARMRLDAFRIARLIGVAPIIFITHTWGGGIERHTKDLTKLLIEQNIPVITFRIGGENGRTIRVEISEEDANLEISNLDQIDIEEHRDALQQILAILNPRLIHVHSTAGLRKESVKSLFDAIQNTQLPYAYTWHDFMPVCHRAQFVTPNRVFCGGPEIDMCRSCLRDDRDAINEFDPEERKLTFGKFISGATVTLAPSQDTADRALAMMPQINVLTRPHIEKFDSKNWIEAAPPPTPPLKVAIIGAIGAHKGSDVLFELVQDANTRHLPIEYFVIGYTDRDDLASLAKISVTGAYKTENEAVNELNKLKPHLCLFPSIWPETYCYALSLSLECGIPPVVFDLGAPAERVRSTGWGRVLPRGIESDPSKTNDYLLSIPLRTLWAERIRTQSKRLPSTLAEYYGNP